MPPPTGQPIQLAPNLFCALAVSRPDLRHGSGLQRHHIIQPHKFEDWLLNTIYLCQSCHAIYHDHGGLTLDELWAAREYTTDDLRLLVLLGRLVEERELQGRYPRVVQRGCWAATQCDADDGLLFGWVDIAEMVQHQLRRRKPIPKWLTSILDGDSL